MRFNCRFQTRNPGRMAKVKSVMILNRLYVYPRPTITSLGMQVPGLVRCQKCDTGLHWKMMTKKKVRPAKTEQNRAV